MLCRPVESDQIIKNIQKGGSVRELEIQLISKNGEARWVSANVDMVNLNGKDCFLTAGIDITKRKEAEEKIKESEHMFSSLFYKSPVMKAIAEASTGKYIEVNDAFADFFELTKEEIVGKTSVELDMLINPEEREQILKRIQIDGIARDVETQIVTKTGRSRWVSTSIDKINLNGKDCFLTAAIDITKRKIAEEKIKESENMFSTLFYKSPIMKSITEASTGKYIEANDAFMDFFGRTKEEMIGKTGKELNMFVHPEHRDQIMKNFQVEGFVRDAETQLNSKNGKTRWVSANINNINLNGNDCLLIVIIDITERKEAEESLAKLNNELEQRVKERTEEVFENEKKYRHIFENNPMPMWVIDLTTFKFLDVNEAAISHYRYSREEFLSMTALDIRPEEDKELYKNADHSENIYPANYNRGTWRHLKKDGTIIYVEVIAHKIVFAGKTARLILSNDVTEKIKVEEEIQKLNEELEQKVIDRTAELQKSNELFSNLFNHNPASIAISGLIDGKLMDVNDAFLLLNGYSSKEEVLGKIIAELNMPVQPEQRGEIGRLLKDNKYIKNLEINMYDKQGNKKWIQLSAITLEVYNVPCLLSVSIDITERKKAEEQLMSVNTELEAFSYSVSHDLRAPLRAVNGYSRMLGESYGMVLDGEGMRLLNRIEENAKKMGLLIDDLLEFSRLGRKEIHTSPVQMTNLAEAALAEINTTIKHNAAVTIHRLHSANADRTMIKQVMINLLSNAIKYSSKIENPSVEIKSHIEESEIIYSVSDNGVGFNNQYVHKLFGVFQRLHLQADFEGTGVGLALVKRIINKHGGRVWGVGELNKGATFSFSLPAGNKN
jgi:PAS domain S-box-containing protein